MSRRGERAATPKRPQEGAKETEGRTWEFNPESGALACDALRCGALSGAFDVALFDSSGTVWSRDLQASRGQWIPPAVPERRANPS